MRFDHDVLQKWGVACNAQGAPAHTAQNRAIQRRVIKGRSSGRASLCPPKCQPSPNRRACAGARQLVLAAGNVERLVQQI